MIFDEIPFELKEYIFTYVTPNEWINTAKVSKEWLELTLGCIKKVQTCHVLILDHLAEFINNERNTDHTWVSLLTLLPRFEHFECFDNTKSFWDEISQVCHRLKILDYKPRIFDFFECTKPDISLPNLVEFLWDGTHEERAFPINLIAFSPKLEKFQATNVEISAEWEKKIPKSVKHILLKKAVFNDDNLLNNLTEDFSALKTFSVEECFLSIGVASKFFDGTPRLKKLELDLINSDVSSSMILETALRKCRGLETVKAHGVIITESWQRAIPENVKSISFFEVNVGENIRPDFSLDWLFQNYGCLQSLELRRVDWSGFDSQNFYSTENLKKLHLDNYESFLVPRCNKTKAHFSDICLRMIRGSHLDDVEICKLTIDESWRHIFPTTIKRLTLKDFCLSNEAELVFLPQFICENVSNIESLRLGTFDGDLPAMNLNAFTGMQMLQELNLNDLCLSAECMQSILTHCSSLTSLFVQGFEADALTKIPRNLIRPSLRKLDVKEPVDQPSLLLQHFPELHTVDIVIVPPDASFSAIMNALQEAETVELRIRQPSSDNLRHLVESIDERKFKYFCLSVASVNRKELSFHWTNSLLDACRKLHDIIIFRDNENVLWINNYPSSPLLNNYSMIPSSTHELSQQYHEVISANVEDWNNDIADDEDEMMRSLMNCLSMQ